MAFAQVSNGAALVDTTKQRMQDIDQRIQRVNDLFSDITAATHEQTAVSADIASHLQSVQQIAEQNAVDASQLEQDSAGLSALASRLGTLSGRFAIR